MGSVMGCVAELDIRVEYHGKDVVSLLVRYVLNRQGACMYRVVASRIPAV